MGLYGPAAEKAGALARHEVYVGGPGGEATKHGIQDLTSYVVAVGDALWGTDAAPAGPHVYLVRHRPGFFDQGQ